jgi:hypothetical protein
MKCRMSTDYSRHSQFDANSKLPLTLACFRGVVKSVLGYTKVNLCISPRTRELLLNSGMAGEL